MHDNTENILFYITTEDGFLMSERVSYLLGCGGEKINAWTRLIKAWFGKREICGGSMEMEGWVSWSWQ